MPDHGALMLAEVVSELVARGIPKYDHEGKDRDWRGPDPCWWVHHPEPSPTAPQTCLLLAGSTDGHDWQFEVTSCACCDAVVCTQLIDHDGEPFASVRFWPGLDAVIRLHQHASELWGQELQRWMRKEQGQPPQWRAA